MEVIAPIAPGAADPEADDGLDAEPEIGQGYKNQHFGMGGCGGQIDQKHGHVVAYRQGGERHERDKPGQPVGGEEAGRVHEAIRTGR